MAVIVHNPYSSEPLPWVRGNLHTHTSGSDGSRTPQQTIDAYAERGYGFLMISDHDVFTDPRELRSKGMALIPGVEVSAGGPHLLHVGGRKALAPEPDRQQVLNAIVGDSGFAIMCHPNWEKTFAHCPQEALETWQGYVGIEVYNGVIRRLEGTPLATDRWDRLLGLGRKVWGYADDDSHRPEDDAIAWNMVQCAERSPQALLEALRQGRCYPSTGVIIESIRVRGATITVRTANAQRIVVHADFGRREAAVDGPVCTFTVPDEAAVRYVRFECWGGGETMAWTQPFIVERVGESSAD